MREKKKRERNEERKGNEKLHRERASGCLTEVGRFIVTPMDLALGTLRNHDGNANENVF